MGTNCKHCGKWTENALYCSRSCACIVNSTGVRRHGKAPGVCIVCGNPKEAAARMFCSNKCQGEYRHQQCTQELLEDKIVPWARVRAHLVEKNYACAICANSAWNGKPLSLQCDHIDGDVTNSKLSNARLLCPNCHSQTDTFGSKNASNPKGKEARRKRSRRESGWWKRQTG